MNYFPPRESDGGRFCKTFSASYGQPVTWMYGERMVVEVKTSNAVSRESEQSISVMFIFHIIIFSINIFQLKSLSLTWARP
jgi:hypothetical protein